MTRRVAFWLAGCVLALLAASMPAQAREMRDAFLWQRVGSVDEFIAQIEANPVIAQRFAKHYHVSQAEFIRYLRDNLTVVTVPETRTYTVYGVNRIGRIYPVKTVLKKGWKAFGLPDGTLLFKWSCGNPLTTTLPAPPPKPVVEIPPPQPTVALPPQPMVAALNEPMCPAYAPDAQPVLLGEPLAMPVEEAPPVAIAAARTLPLWPLVGLLGVRGHGEPPPVVPEPNASMLMATGIGLLVAVMLWRRRDRVRVQAAGLARWRKP